MLLKWLRRLLRIRSSMYNEYMLFDMRLMDAVYDQFDYSKMWGEREDLYFAERRVLAPINAFLAEELQ